MNNKYADIDSFEKEIMKVNSCLKIFTRIIAIELIKDLLAKKRLKNLSAHCIQINTAEIY